METAQKKIAIGIQDFSSLIQNGYFYIDKTEFIREWWESGDSATLLNRPRRFGKTLNMSMVEQFFSLEYADQGKLFEALSIWNHEKYRSLQGTFPVISLSFARVKEKNFQQTKDKIYEILTNLYVKFSYLRDSEKLTDTDRLFIDRILKERMRDSDATSALYQLASFLYRHYGKKVIILLDEYDTPMQEAYVNGYWDDLAAFIRSLFNSTFKTNPYMERGILTGITTVSKESIFSDLNNLKVITLTSEEYADSFGFTQEEVFHALDAYGLTEKNELVKKWYDGFTIGKRKDIYNPWSILNFLDKRLLGTYWANTSSNSLISKLLREGNYKIKEKFEALLSDQTIFSVIDEQIVYNQLNGSEKAIFSLLLTSGYLRIISRESYEELSAQRMPRYQLKLTNLEVKLMFQNMILDWFADAEGDYNDFILAMLTGDLDAMNAYMNRVALQTFSYFDTGKNASSADPERFYHGFVLGLLVELKAKYTIRSNRESGFGRYDVILEPKEPANSKAFILEFKVRNPGKEKTLEETAKEALLQIKEKKYEEELLHSGITKPQIHCYGFAFEGKKVLIAEELPD